MVSNITRGRNINLNDHNPTYSCILVPRADDDVRRHSSGKQFVPRPVSHPLVGYILFVFLCALRGPAWAVASYSNSQPATGIPQTIISKPGPRADGKPDTLTENRSTEKAGTSTPGPTSRSSLLPPRRRRHRRLAERSPVANPAARIPRTKPRQDRARPSVPLDFPMRRQGPCNLES